MNSNKTFDALRADNENNYVLLDRALEANYIPPTRSQSSLSHLSGIETNLRNMVVIANYL
jgi:hypothetical protein